MPTIVLAILTLSLSTDRLFAHGPETHSNDPSWTFDPWIIIPLLVLGVPYAVGSVVLWRRTTVARSLRQWQALSFLGGWLTIAAALVSPLHWLGEHLFCFHMIEHEILMAVSAPLLVVARPIGTLLWSLPRDIRAAAGRLLKRPPVSLTWAWLTTGRNATLVHGGAIWAWHAPILFDAAVTSAPIHRLQHLSFLLTAVLFWWSVLWRSNAGVAAWHLFVTMLHTTILGALMALAPGVLYQPQPATAAAWGLTPLEDQQLAGLIMWVPAATIYAAAALALIALWIRRSSETGRRGDAVRAI
ncbi:cytochrome c oxidase assembly protein [Bradyrhizobium australiense]|uniref:Cytochrome c oxidase assembly protein n=1 Tax=Bradyrhizobium australiense TaxID=2721161 RepID=A0A7Y4LXF8_9BRAD|nr:cytochrome c oxidase assembly protein [Bradyrhizobium australiense]